ncbi:esterase/lipase family protein [Allorhodopirellula heiligendammensis]|uniref:Alpha/beta hydrolase family protein n=1 Tax=Allorhodopirellula heiligendammensis TaxID=2714739 RepID=A0A5C6BGH3_9BACT|nr:alpha/beta fold hydrolase [Allorhodopirellula heiligendammensis]TWU10581.1 Alpha/beta hydrolase family protein [Allorhodopirellula heiligendammensis]
MVVQTPTALSNIENRNRLVPVGLAVVFAACLLVGCRPTWLPTRSLKNATSRSTAVGIADQLADTLAAHEPIEVIKRELADAQQLHADSDPRCTERFLIANRLAWATTTDVSLTDAEQRNAAAAMYHESLRGFIESAQRFGQLDPVNGIHLNTANGDVSIPIVYHGFAWTAEDFNQWLPVGKYHDDHLTCQHKRSGWGVPLVVLRSRAEQERFMIPQMPFAATVMLRELPVDGDQESSETAPDRVLEVFNPLVHSELPRDAGGETPLAGDLSAPIAWLSNNTPHLNYEGFMHPDRMQRNGQLIMLEPYQPGKIPLVLVHGLASDPRTWNGLINELRMTDWFNSRYQIWLFGYPTGRPFLSSAAELRRECGDAIASFTEQTGDPALKRSVVIGHSMGGLLTKLQVVNSGSNLWESFANRPITSLKTDQQMHDYLTDLFFFESSPFVQRAIFIGTPHGGSPIADEWIGQLASHLVKRSHDRSDEYNHFLAGNREAITPFYARQIPTSIHMLKPTDPTLQVMRRLPLAPHVRLHSVIGNGRMMLNGGPADGVVPVVSARHQGADSERIVATTHRRLQSHPDTVAEVLRILKLHLDEPTELSDAETPAGLSYEVCRQSDLGTPADIANPVR